MGHAVEEGSGLISTTRGIFNVLRAFHRRVFVLSFRRTAAAAKIEPTPLGFLDCKFVKRTGGPRLEQRLPQCLFSVPTPFFYASFSCGKKVKWTGGKTNASVGASGHGFLRTREAFRCCSSDLTPPRRFPSEFSLKVTTAGVRILTWRRREG